MGILVDKKVEHEPIMHSGGKKGCIRKTVVSRSRGVVLVLYLFLVRPQLEYYVQICPLRCKKRHGHTGAKVTKMIKGEAMGTFSKRLREPGFLALKRRLSIRKKIATEGVKTLEHAA